MLQPSPPDQNGFSSEPALTDSQILGDAPWMEGTKPSIHLQQPPRELAIAIAQNLPADTLYRFHDSYITLATERLYEKEGFYTKRIIKTEMTPERFVSWVENYVSFHSFAKDDRRKKVGMGLTLARCILASDELRQRTPRIREIVKVRLPVWTDDTHKGLTVADDGYNPVSEVYTISTLDWDAAKVYPVAAIIKALSRLFEQFPWAEPGPWHRKRSAAVFMALMIGQFMRHCISRHPIVVVTANQKGSGKTLLASMAISPVVGAPAFTPKPDDEESLQKAFNTFVLDGEYYAFLDNVSRLYSPTIELFATAPYIKGRILQTQRGFEVENRMQIIATGNGLKTSKDIARRALFITLFSDDDVRERTIENSLDPGKLGNPEWRRQLLIACWSIVHHWHQAGCPILCRGDRMPSFETYAEIVGSILLHAGFADPFEAPPVGTADIGDTKEDSIIYLLRHLATLIVPGAAEVANEDSLAPATQHKGLSRVWRVGEIVEVARAINILDIICNSQDPGKSMGHQIREYKGRIFSDAQGRKFRFGRREDRAGTAYPMIIMSEPLATDSA